MQQMFSWLLSIIPSAIIAVVMMLPFFYRFRGKKYANLSNGEMKRISLDSAFLRWFGLNREAFYYDCSYFYMIRGENTTKVALADIIKVNSGTTKINNRRVWSVTYLQQGAERQVKFVHNFTLFNRDFAGFLSAVKSANPQADVKDATLFTL